MREFFDIVPSISTYDPLAKTLGAFENGIIKYKYTMAVKYAGHSCPTVAGAYMMTYHALKALYGEELPVRGGVSVELKESRGEGVAGVIGAIITLISGASDEAGFKGLGGQYSRANLLNFNANISSSARFTRVDNGQSVDVYYDPSSVKPDKRMEPFMKKVISQSASEEEIKEFGNMWQDRVRRILIDNFYNEEVIRVVKG